MDMIQESTREKREDGKLSHSGLSNLIATLGLTRRPQQTKLEAMINQKIPADSLHHSEVVFVLKQGDPQPGVLALCQLRSELLLEGWIK
jgi:hypothetical protein